MHIHSLSWLKQLLAFCWREPFPRPYPPLNSFSCCLYIESQSHSTIFYIRFSIYIFSFCSVPFRYLCCHVLLALFTRRHLLYLVWYLLLVTPLPPAPTLCICLHFIDAKVLLTNLAKNANLQWKLIHMRPWQWKERKIKKKGNIANITRALLSFNIIYHWVVCLCSVMHVPRVVCATCSSAAKSFEQPGKSLGTQQHTRLITHTQCALHCKEATKEPTWTGRNSLFTGGGE